MVISVARITKTTKTNKTKVVAVPATPTQREIGLGKIYVEDEHQLEMIWNVKQFEDLLQRKIGMDAVDYFRWFLEDFKDSFRGDGTCSIECDKLYSMQEGYERCIKDALEVIDINLNRTPEARKKRKSAKWKDASDIDFLFEIEEILKGAL